MENKKILALVVDSPYSTPLLPEKIRIIKHLLEHQFEIALFFYIDGIHQLQTEQFPKNFANIGQQYAYLHQLYPDLQFYACSRCTAARGYISLNQSNLEEEYYVSSKLFPFVQIVSIRKFGELLAKGYRLLQL
ncbi:MAG: DsrE family protein [Candidatus Lokiarchaeota archaeon]|nr:DsrE family protein [Candidatus Harpocratesius repetitus]